MTTPSSSWSDLPNELREKILEGLKPTIRPIVYPRYEITSTKRQYISQLSEGWKQWAELEDPALIHILAGVPSSSAYPVPSHDAIISSASVRPETIVFPVGTAAVAGWTFSCLNTASQVARTVLERAPRDLDYFDKVGRVVLDSRILGGSDDQVYGYWSCSDISCRWARENVLSDTAAFSNAIGAEMQVEADKYFKLPSYAKQIITSVPPDRLTWRGLSLDDLPIWGPVETVSSFKQHVYDIEMTASCRDDRGWNGENVIDGVVRFIEAQNVLLSKLEPVPSRPIILRLHVDDADDRAQDTLRIVESNMPETGSVVLQFGGETVIHGLPYEVA